MEETIRVDHLFKIWNIAEEMVREDIEWELRKEWELRREWGYYDDDEIEEFDFEKMYEELPKINDWEMSMITLGMLDNYNAQGVQERIDEARRLVKSWWRDKPQLLNRCEFWDICMTKFTPDCYQWLWEHLDEIEMYEEE